MRVVLEERRLLEALRAQPALLARVEELVELTRVESIEAVGTADEIEARVVEGVRDLGRQLIGGWAQAAERQVAAGVRREHPQARLREKNGEVAHHLRRGRGAREPLAAASPCRQELPPALCRARRRYGPGLFASAGAGGERTSAASKASRAPASNSASTTGCTSHPAACGRQPCARPAPSPRGRRAVGRCAPCPRAARPRSSWPRRTARCCLLSPRKPRPKAWLSAPTASPQSQSERHGARAAGGGQRARASA